MLCCGFRSFREEVDLVIYSGQSTMSVYLVCVCEDTQVCIYPWVCIHGTCSRVKSSSLLQIPFILLLFLDDSPGGNLSPSKASL